MVLQAFMDESENEEGSFVIAGHIATAEAWAAFSKEWEERLPFRTLAPNNKKHFKMSEMASLKERMERVPAFYKVIESHVLLAISCSVSRPDLERAKARLYVPNNTIDWDFADNIYRFTFHGLLNTFNRNRAVVESAIPPDQAVDFIFDERMEKKSIKDEWDGFVESREPEIRKLFGSSPRFGNDQDFLPLQAADFWAWWVQKRWPDTDREEKLLAGDFDTWRGEKNYPKLLIFYDEQTIVDLLAEHLANHVDPIMIFDHGNPVPKWRL